MTVANNEFSRASYMPVRIKGVMPHGANYWQDNGVTEPTRDDYVYHVEFNHIYEYGEGILSDFGGIYMGKSTMRRQACHKNSRRFECHMATRGGPFPIPKNRNPGSIGVFWRNWNRNWNQRNRKRNQRNRKRNQKGIVFRFQFLFSQTGRRNRNS